MKPNIQRWFMPWRWSRWIWMAIIVPMAAAMYLLSAVPVDKLKIKMRISPHTSRLISDIYVPAFSCIERSEVAMAIAEWQDKVMNRFVMDVRSDPPLYRAKLRRERASPSDLQPR